MKRKLWACLGAATFCGATLCLSVALCAEPTGEAAEKAKEPGAKETSKPVASEPIDDTRIPLAVARERAKVMHSVYAATLEAMHHHYFHGDRAIVPARALEDVFGELDRQTNIKARWISVNTKAMSIGHEPKTDFEKQAAKEIGKGQEAVERVEDGVYYRAGAIPLTEGCIACHTGFFSGKSRTPSFAGLVIGVPFEESTKK